MTIFQVKYSDNSFTFGLCLFFAGAMVLAHSLRDNGTKKQLAALVTLDTLQATTIGELKVRRLLENTLADNTNII